MTVYIEYVLIDNLLIDYMLLKATFLITGNGYKKGRLLFCAFLGAGFALLFPLLKLPNALIFVLKILSGILIVLLSAKFKNVRALYVNTAVFLALTFAIGGAIMGIYGMAGLGLTTEISVALVFLPAFILIRALSGVVKFIYRRKEVASLTVDCELVINGESVKLKGFFDTGNGLYDGDSPIIVCEKKLFMKLFAKGKKLPVLKKIEFATVAGKSQMFVAKIDLVKIYNGQTVNIFNNVTLGVSGGSVGQGYDVILHPSLGGENGNIDTGVKKAS